MASKTVTVGSSVGLHARPAALVAQAAGVVSADQDGATYADLCRADQLLDASGHVGELVGPSPLSSSTIDWAARRFSRGVA